MKSSVEPLEGNKVKLSIEVDENEFDKAIDAAFRKIAREVRIPGFRPGKAPRRLLEARIGSEVARQEALRDALPDYYARAVRENSVDVIAPPEIDITAGEDEGIVTFDAVVEVRPRVQVPGYGGLRVTVPSPVAGGDDVDRQIDRLREQHAELNAVSRPARDGDHVSIDLNGTRHGEPVEGLSASDYLYELGSGSVVPELDTQLQGARAGDILKFNAVVPALQSDTDSGEVTLQVLVKEVKEKVLPEPTDEWAAEASEFETIAELRDDLRERISSVKRLQTQLALRDEVIGALVELVEEEPPEPLVQGELERRVRDLAHRLAHQGADIATYLQATGRSEEELLAELRDGALRAVKADLALRAVADAETLEATDDEIDAEVARLAQRMDEKPAKVRRELERAEQMPAVTSDVRKGKALEWLVEHVEVVDEDGNTIDRSELTLPSADAEEHDHEHDHEHEVLEESDD
jgi:trigger factor